MFKQNKVSLTASFISVFSFIGVSPVFAADINFDNWSVFGDVITDSMGETSLSTNALADDDFEVGDDTLFNFSGNPAIDSLTLEENLGVNIPPGLDPDPDNFVQAFEGSGLTQTFNFIEPTTLSFDFTFLTNDETFTDEDGFDFDDYAFVVIDGTVIPIAGTFDALFSSTTNYQREISGRFTQTFEPGTIQIGLGVVDVGDFVESSALVISNGQTEIASIKVNEPSFIGGLLGLGIWVVLTIAIRNEV